MSSGSVRHVVNETVSPFAKNLEKVMDTPTRPTLALDIDGVICDGRDEALVTSFNAFNRGDGQRCQ